MDQAEDPSRRDSRRLARLFGWIFGFSVVVLISEVFYIPTKRMGFALGSDRSGAAVLNWLDTLLLALPAVALLVALWSARRLFLEIAENGAFTPSSGRFLGRIGTWLLVSSVAMVLVTDSESLRPSSTGDLPLVATAVVLGCVGLAMRLLGRFYTQAVALKAENSQFF